MCRTCKKLFWNLTIFQEPEGKWHVKGGEALIFSADASDEVEAFLYGMGLAYAGILGAGRGSARRLG